jgi:hypothetical protein
MKEISMKMKRSRAALLVGGVVLAGALLFARSAFSGKATDTAGSAPINTGPSPMPAAGGCDTGASFEMAQKLVGQVIDAKRWTAKDHERIAPLFYQLRTEQKIEILRRVGAALDSRRLVLEKGARLF